MDNLEERAAKLLLDLVKIKSETGREWAVAQYLTDHLKHIGGMYVRNYQGNVVAVIKGGNSGKLLNFNTHMDTVPSNGLKPEIRGNRVYGRGAVDAKASIVAMLLSAEELSSRRDMLKGNVVYTFVICEESINAGVKYMGTPQMINMFNKEFYHLPDAVIIGEPSQKHYEADYSFLCGEMGSYSVLVSLDDLKLNNSDDSINTRTVALSIKHKVDLAELNSTCRIYAENNYQGMDNWIAINSVYQTGGELASIKSVIADAILRTFTDLRLRGVCLKGEAFQMIERMERPSWVQEDSELASIAIDVFPGENGRGKMLDSFASGTDARYFIDLSTPLEIIIAGPGCYSLAHSDNESIAPSSVVFFREAYTQMAQKFLE